MCLADDVVHELGFGLVPAGDDAAARSELESACLESHHALDRSSEKTLVAAREALQLTEAQLELIRGEAAKLGQED